MDRSICFSIDRFNIGSKNEGRFELPKTLSDADGEICRALDIWEGGGTSSEQLVGKMRELLREFPDLIDAHVTIGRCTFVNEPIVALDHYQRGFATGIAAMPAEFDGTLSYRWFSNRPFLRAVHGLALSYRAVGDHQKAVNILERSLKWNPTDNLGCRKLLSEYVNDSRVIVSFVKDGLPGQS